MIMKNLQAYIVICVLIILYDICKLWRKNNKKEIILGSLFFGSFFSFIAFLLTSFKLDEETVIFFLLGHVVFMAWHDNSEDDWKRIGASTVASSIMIKK